MLLLLLQQAAKVLLTTLYFSLQGAITFRGQMIDMPLVKQAFNVLTMAEATKLK